ncbi:MULTISPECIES: phosphate signaling complex protein PhoU [Niallia]|jgi:phosphate transport system protein|uniref:Phosphate-specific transport system accessory protein PhoU n=1 Tax=Niallia circulans TaxID=1397 RepID=A0A268F6D5_NIACI|nr:phosphate signaling complex protein PhoU [Niallia circulans]AYV67141.1 phosphate transport system regulatory protein PhoU [Niallia circulans]AYV74587.1 phosphate transport system regulatory protein PhoU [Niallia circulans]NRG26887.1 phosphate signaling complex protein PhoU [Niallia circulans]PAD80945.1 phosphate transport system regulatory protein PhoU [Niallia circulans]QJX63103.1 phosphate signaling complex protein PhoU [Niallia circulans]
MPVREKFEAGLKELQEKLTELGEFSIQALERSLEALETQNIEMALEIIDDDQKADHLYEEINDFAILLIAKQAPVAIDLRRIIVGIKIATDIERIADFAVNIAKATIRIGNQELVKPMIHVKKMLGITNEMLRLSLNAYNKEDTKLARKIAEMDDEVDALNKQAFVELLEISKNKPEYLQQISQLTFVCRYLERAADHTTNIAENIFYLVKGRQYDW